MPVMTALPDAPIRVDEYPATSRSLRIAVVTETYPPEVNGVSLTVARIVEGLHARNHDLQLVRPRQTPDDEAECAPRFHEALMRGLPIPRYPHLKMGLPAKKALVRLWSTSRPDIVHVATEGPLGYSALHAARQLKLPVTSDFRTNFHAYSRYYGMGWMKAPIMAYLRRFHNATSTTMVPTEPLRAELAAIGFRNVVVVARGVDTHLFDPARRDDALRGSWGVGPGDLVVACVGRLAAEKNLGTLLDAFRAVAEAHPRARLLLVGDGPMQESLSRAIPDAIFAGSRSGIDLATHYASADLFLFPSLTETFGNVTCEAMASGLPVVAFDYAAAAQLIESGRNGLLVERGDGNAFVAAACRIAADAEQRKHLGAAARARACMQDWDSVIARFETLLAGAIQPKAPSEIFDPSALSVA
jgi:glycosyltransferase involved in cell wall biosynthesis